MSDLVLFHHVQGLTDGVRELAERLREDGYTVHTPDLFGGKRADSLPDGFAIVEQIGEDTLNERANAAVTELGENLVYAGISWGVPYAQRFAQTRPGARGALLLEACLPITGDWAIGPWPDGVPVQIHGMDHDEYFANEGDLDAARELVDAIGPELGAVFTYPGDAHLFTDSSLPSYDAAATTQVVQRSLVLLDRVK